MSDKILSVGLDIGTATTQLILSELTIENISLCLLFLVSILQIKSSL